MEMMSGVGYGRRSAPGMCLLVLCAVFALVAAGASIAVAAPAELWDACQSGAEAGQCNTPRGVAADPHNGHLLVADQNNHRIAEFNALGQFVKAWGWGVDTGAGELQSCTATSGCQAGLEGSGTGELSAIAPGVALDSVGNVYVTDRGFLGSPSVRVQKFSPAGQFLLMFGGGVNKTKNEEVGSTEAERNLCTAVSGDVCQKGTVGTGHGQFGEWSIGDFIAIDENGTGTDSDDKVYVGDVGRVQIFDTGGVYQGEFAVAGTVEGLATDPSGNLYAIFGGEVHKLSPSGESLPLSFEVEVPTPSAVAVGSAGQVFVFGAVSFNGNPSNPVFEFDPAGNLVDNWGKGEFIASTGLATNLCEGSEAPGNLYVTNADSSEAFLRAYGTEPVGCFKARTGPAENIAETNATLTGTVNPNGSPVSECRFEYGPATPVYGNTVPCAESPLEIGEGSEPVPVHANVSGLDKGTVYHFRLLAKVGGETETGADESFKTLGPPVISADRTVNAAYTEATLKAFVNPEGFATTYRFEYGPSIAYGQSTSAIGVGSDRSDHPAIANLRGLAPGATYHWRIVATSSSGVTAGEDHTVATYRLPGSGPDLCSNRVFRTADSALLPDCRAYEMVSPVDKNGADILSGRAAVGDPPEAGGYVQASADGGKITYTAVYASFADQPNSFKFNQYLASREEGEGWASGGIHPPVAGHLVGVGLFGLSREFIAFSPDLCSAWLVDSQTPPLAADGQEGLWNLYRRDNCEPGAGNLETMTPSPPVLPGGTEVDYVDRNSVQGVSADSRHALFTARAKLTGDAAPGDVDSQIYDRFGGENHLVSVRPDGSGGDPAPGDGVGFADPGESAVGNSSSFNLEDAVSADGSRVYWTSSPASTGGKIYLRQHPEQGIIGGECTTLAKACTLAVSGGSKAFFWRAAPDGSKALYGEEVVPGAGADLYEFDLHRAEAGEPPRLVASHVRGVAGASDDLSRIYFVSRDQLTGEEENGNKDKAQTGQPNLYLEEGGAFTFVATLIDADIEGVEPGGNVRGYNPVASFPIYRASRVTPDGARIAFESRGSLTGYDNADAESGRAAVEVFTYEAGGGALACISCNPSGGRPRSRALPTPYQSPFEKGLKTNVPAAAWIPTWEHPLHASSVLSADGRRLFFNSNDALLPRDANGAQDVYEWEAPGSGSCDLGAAAYIPQNGGCLYLISSGTSPFQSELWEATPDGRDAFFTTASSLLPQDPGLVDLYDARVGGGFPQAPQAAPCEGEACQSPPPPPQLPDPASSTYNGPGNPGKAQHRCPKGKRKVRSGGRSRCVPKQHGKHQRHRANHDRRAGR